MKTAIGLVACTWFSFSLLAAAQTFTLQQYATGRGPTQVIRADFNRDGILDLATLNTDGNSISILLGKGDGSFRLPKDFVIGNNNPGVTPVSMVAVDLNKDGKMDIVTVNHAADPHTMSVFLGNGDGTSRWNATFSADRIRSGSFPVTSMGTEFLISLPPGTFPPLAPDVIPAIRFRSLWAMDTAVSPVRFGHQM